MKFLIVALALFVLSSSSSSVLSLPIDFNLYDQPCDDDALGKLPHHISGLPYPAYPRPVHGLYPYPGVPITGAVPHPAVPIPPVIPPVAVPRPAVPLHPGSVPHPSHGFNHGHFVHGYDHIPSHLDIVPPAYPHPEVAPYPEPHYPPPASYLPVPAPAHPYPVGAYPHDEYEHLKYHHGRLPGDGFGPGGHFAHMPRPEVKLVSVPVPVSEPYPYPIDEPYPVSVEKPYPVYVERPIPRPYISRILQPHIHKTAVIKTDVVHQPVAHYPPEQLRPLAQHLAVPNHPYLPYPPPVPVRPEDQGVSYDYVKKKKK